MSTEIVKCLECIEEILKHNCEIKCNNSGFFSMLSRYLLMLKNRVRYF